MAEEKKSIEISYKANIADLKAKLKTIPNITEQEAKKMVAALDRQLKQAEKAAKKSAEASKKAARSSAQAARRGAKDFDLMADSAAKAEQRLEGVADASGDIDRGFSSVGLALREVNPRLAEAADGLADTFAVVEGLTMSFKALNPFVVAAAVAIGALTLGYQSHKKELEKVRELTLKYRDAQKALIDSQKEQRNNLDEAASTYREIEERIELATGAISEYDFAIREAGRGAFEGIQDNIKAQEILIQEKKKEIAFVKRLEDSALTLGKAQIAISDKQKEQLETLQLQTKSVNNRLNITQKGTKQSMALSEMYKEGARQLREMEKNLAGLKNLQGASVERAKQLADFQHEQAQEADRLAKAAEDKLKADQASAELAANQAQIAQDLKNFKKQQAKSEEEILEARERLSDELVKILGSEEDLIDLKYDNEIERLEELAQKAEETGSIEQAITKLQMERDQEKHDKRMDQLRKEQQAAIQQGEAFVSAFSSGLETSADALEELSRRRAEEDIGEMERELQKQRQRELGEAQRITDLEERSKAVAAIEAKKEKDREDFEKKRAAAEQAAAVKAFTLRQGAALAETLMNTAKGIVNALATYPGPAGAALAGVIAATGATQAGLISSQQPPSFHMGGMASDETSARVLKGEAILDRATVRRIGGEEGVKRLQQGGQKSDNVVVIQPFRHFGRFAREIGFRTPKKTGMRR